MPFMRITLFLGLKKEEKRKIPFEERAKVGLVGSGGGDSVEVCRDEKEKRRRLCVCLVAARST